MPQRNDWSTCDVCGEIHEQIVLFEFREGLYFEICQPCMVAAQQLYALDAALVASALVRLILSRASNTNR